MSVAVHAFFGVSTAYFRASERLSNMPEHARKTWDSRKVCFRNFISRVGSLAQGVYSVRLHDRLQPVRTRFSTVMRTGVCTLGCPSFIRATDSSGTHDSGTVAASRQEEIRGAWPHIGAYPPVTPRRHCNCPGI